VVLLLLLAHLVTSHRVRLSELGASLIVNVLTRLRHHLHHLLIQFLWVLLAARNSPAVSPMDLTRLNLENWLLVLRLHLGEEAHISLGEAEATALHRPVSVEILLKVSRARHAHGGIQASQIVAVRDWALLELPPDGATGHLLLNHVIFIVDLDQVVDHVLIIGDVSVAQLMNLIEDLVHFLHHLGRAHPELALRVSQALCLYFFDLNDSEVSLLTPLKLFVQKVEHCEVKTPHVVTAC